MQPSGNSNRDPGWLCRPGSLCFGEEIPQEFDGLARATSYGGLRRESCQRCGLLSSAWRTRAANCVCVYRTRTRSQAASKLAQSGRATVS